MKKSELKALIKRVIKEEIDSNTVDSYDLFQVLINELRDLADHPSEEIKIKAFTEILDLIKNYNEIDNGPDG